MPRRPTDTILRLRPRAAKVLADLYGNKARSALVVASIAVGVFAIGVIAGAYVMLSEDLATSYEASNPANITVVTLPFGADLIDAVSRLEGVADAEGVREVTVRARAAQPEDHAEADADSGVAPSWENLTLIAQPEMADSQIHRRFGKEGVSAPLDRELVLEHQTLDELGVGVGDAIEIELPDGTRRVLSVVGTAIDQSDLYDTVLGGLRGYVTLDTLPWLHSSATMTKLYVTVAGDSDDVARIREVGAGVTDRLDRVGYPVFQTEIAGTHEHPFGGIIQALLWILIIVGLMIVLLSGSLIANTMSALLTQHLRQIGVMKLVGARRLQVVGSYMLMISTFGVLALLVSILPASWGAYALARLASGIINFRLRPFELVPVAVVVQVVVALVVPPISGLGPVLKGSRVTVRRALSSTGLGDHEDRSGLLDRLLARLRALSRPVLISVRNTFRRKKRLVLTLLTLTLGGAVFIGVLNTQVALDRTTEALTRYFGADVTLDFTEPYRTSEVAAELSALPGVVGVEVWVTTGADLVRDDDAASDTIGVIAPPAHSALIEPQMIEGRWLLPADDNAITVNEAIWDDFPALVVGDQLRLKVNGREDDWTVVGIFQYTGTGGIVAYANYDYVADLLNQPYHATSFRLVTDQHSLAYQEEVALQVSSLFRDQGYSVATAEAGKKLTNSIPSLLGIVTDILLVMALMTALVGSIGLTGTMGMNVMERTREIGVMRAIGAHNGIVLKLVIIEGLVIGLISYGLGAVLAFPVGALLSNVISVAIFGISAEPAVTAQGFIIWLLVVMGLSVLSSLLPARNASRLTIREVLAYE